MINIIDVPIKDKETPIKDKRKKSTKDTVSKQGTKLKMFLNEK